MEEIVEFLLKGDWGGGGGRGGKALIYFPHLESQVSCMPGA